MKSFKTFILEQQDPYHEKFHSSLKERFPKEYDIIIKAAARNEIPDTNYEDLATLFAIRRAEKGKMGKEMGVLAPGAGLKPGDTPESSLDRQVGWAASTLIKNKKRFSEKGGKGDFIEYFGNVWAPIGAENDPTNLNKNWIGNVKKFRKEHLDCVGVNCTQSQSTQNVQPQPAPTVQKQEQPKVQQTPQQNDDFYTVKSGDTLWSIGGKNPKRTKEIQDLNPDIDPNKIKPGQKIKIR
jgi:hypothetical protein